MVLKETDLKQRSKTIISSIYFGKVTVQRSITELWTVISNQMIKYQPPRTRFDQISDHKHDINTSMESYLQSYQRKQLMQYQKQ